MHDTFVQSRRVDGINVAVDEESVMPDHGRQHPHHRVKPRVRTPIGVHLVHERRGADHIYRVGDQCRKVLRPALDKMTGAHSRECFHRFSQRM